MTGSEVETTVEASIETNIPSSRPESAWSTRRWWRLSSSTVRDEEVDVAMGSFEIDANATTMARAVERDNS
jgi:hypothetical protein